VEIRATAAGSVATCESTISRHSFEAGYEAIRRQETMMKAALRTLAAVFIGLFVAFVLIVAVELFGDVVHPLPKDFEGTMEEMCRHVERYPQWVLAVVVPMWGLAALVSTWIAQRIGNLYSAGVVGLLLLSGLVFNISKLPYPIWFKIVNLLVIPAAIVAGSRLSGRRRTAGPGKVE
jgi:hypothetical protein